MTHHPEETLVLVKPDGYRRGLTGEVLRRIEAKGYTLAALSVLGIAGAAAAGWAVWEYWLKDKLSGDSSTTTKRTTAAPTRTETNSRGTSTLVYSTRTEDAKGTSVRSELRPDADMRGAGPLGEEPAERDEELLASIDEQLTTLDALDDDQREATAPHHQNQQGGKHELNADREVDNR